MDNKDLLKKIESLEKRLSQLESQKKSNLSMFGRSYTQAGNSDSDFLIKTKGQVKIQWGSKFIDLIKDGKINVDSSFIFTVKSADKLGVKDGLYVIDDGAVYLKVGDTVINLVGEIGTTYVSFLEEQETTSEQKYMALQNVGFIYKDMSSISDHSLKNGIIYIESEEKLYIVKDGSMSEFTIAFPNPFTEQFIIAKSDSSKGALLIKGHGVNNSVAFENLFIYNEFGNSYIDSAGDIYFKIGQEDKLIISNGGVTFVDPAISSMFKSDGATEASGFRLYNKNGESTLEVDNIIIRKGSNNDASAQQIYPVYWYSKNNIIKKVEPVINPDNPTESGYQVELIYENQYQVGDSIYVYVTIKGENYNSQVKLPFTVVSLDTEYGNTIYVQVDQNSLDSSDLSLTSTEDLLGSLGGQVTFLVGSKETPGTILRRSEKGIDLVESANFEQDSNLTQVQSRFGELTELGLSETSKGEDVPIEGYGVYSKQTYFEKAAYTKGYNLSEDDDSSKLASTEWVNKKLSSLNVEIDLTIREDEENIDIEKYFSKPEIQQLLQDQEVGTTVAYLGQFGVITIAKSERDYTFSAIVRAITDERKWSHRSINGTYDSLTGTWYGTSTYIIKDQFNPGYYWAKELENSKPVSPEYIGTTNTEVVSETISYILYTNDGKVWKIIDKYIAPDPDLVYFSASGLASCNLQNAQTVPMGFIGIVKTDGTNQVNVGKSNYAISSFDKDDPITGDIRGQIPKATRALLINTLKDAQPGVIPSIPGLPTSFYIKKSDISTIPENSIHKLKGSEGGLSPTTIFQDAKVYVRNIIQSICRWTNSEGLKYNTTHPGTYKSVGDIDFWRNDLNIRILAGAILCGIFQSVQNISAKEARDAVYSDVVGFAQAYTATHWENFDFFQMSGVCESSFAAPTDDESNAKAGLRMNNSISIICNATHIYGEFHVTYRDYRWPESPDPNYPYLSAVWAIDDKTKINEAYRLPYPVEIQLGLVFDGINARYKIEGTVGSGLSISAT